MSDAIVALLGWNSSTRGWNEGAWNAGIALPGATGAITGVAVSGDGNIGVTGTNGTGAVGSVTVIGGEYSG